MKNGLVTVLMFNDAVYQIGDIVRIDRLNKSPITGKIIGYANCQYPGSWYVRLDNEGVIKGEEIFYMKLIKEY